MKKWLLLVVLSGATLAVDAEEGRFLRPVDGSAFTSGAIQVIAKAPGGRLELDGQGIETQQRYPNVLEATLHPSPGTHQLTLVWEGRRKEIRFYVGDDPPAGFQAFNEHPSGSTDCLQCHSLSSRGRFRFRGGCFDCHQQEQFVETHRHPPHVFEQCGQCHNAHGSTAKAHFILPREKACGLCHSLPN